MTPSIKDYAKAGQKLTAWDGTVYDLDGTEHIVTSVGEQPFDHPKLGQKRYFVLTHRVNKDGKEGKRQASFWVSERGSISPADNGK